MSRDDLDRRAACWLDGTQLDRVEAYLRAGRPHRGLRTVELRRRWVGQFERWTRDLGDADARRLHETLSAELRLRDEEPPYEEVPEALDRLLGEVRRRIDAMEPEQAQRLNAALERGIGELHGAAAASRH